MMQAGRVKRARAISIQGCTASRSWAAKQCAARLVSSQRDCFAARSGTATGGRRRAARTTTRARARLTGPAHRNGHRRTKPMTSAALTGRVGWTNTWNSNPRLPKVTWRQCPRSGFELAALWRSQTRRACRTALALGDGGLGASALDKERPSVPVRPPVSGLRRSELRSMRRTPPFPKVIAKSKGRRRAGRRAALFTCSRKRRIVQMTKRARRAVSRRSVVR
jgi:hypothetical protein